MLEPMSWLKSGRLPLASGDNDGDPIETVLSDGARGLLERGIVGGVGGASPLPLPRMRPPPSFRPDMAAGDTTSEVWPGHSSSEGADDRGLPDRASTAWCSMLRQRMWKL